MPKIRKINVSEIEGRNPWNEESIFPAGTITVYDGESVGEYALRIHDGETNGGNSFAGETGTPIEEITYNQDNSNHYVRLNSNGLAISLNDGNADIVPVWEFNTDGSTYLPRNSGNGSPITYFGTPINDTNIELAIQAGNGIRLTADAYKESGGVAVWQFDTDGNLTLPANGDMTLVGGQIAGGESTVVADGINSITLALGATMDVYGFPFSGVQRGQVTITGDMSTTQALGTWYYQSTSPTSFELYTDETYSTLVDASDWTAYTGGGILAITKQSTLNDVVINSNGFLTKFGVDGTLTIPGDVVDIRGVNQLANRVEGSWTLPSDTTNIYSFTVPTAGTYTMWVKGNIPNGIIVWNATVSVSNSNVPAIGTQYAWNYTGGGSPIELIDLPNQIRGVAGTISTDDTYAGTTSNRFDFNISNDTETAQTIYYGYTKI